MELGIVSFAAITAIVFVAGYAWKTASKLDDKWIPVVCATLGMLLGILCYVVRVPDFPADDIVNAAAVGIESGLAATGFHQIWKQLNKDE